MKFTFESCTTYFKMLQKILSNSDAKTDIYTRAPTHKIQSDGGVERRAIQPQIFSLRYLLKLRISTQYLLSTVTSSDLGEMVDVRKIR